MSLTIGDFLTRIKRPIELDEETEYKLVTIKMHHKGVHLRGLKKGRDIKSKMFQVKEGDFILSGIDARNGAFGIIPKELDNAIVTNDFWYFELNTEIINKDFFLELTSTDWFDNICRLGSDGTTQRIRLQKDRFFNQSITLPQITEQKKLIDKFIKIKFIKYSLEMESEDQQTLLIQLRQSIVQNAFEGKLTEKWRKTNIDIEPVSVLLKKIKSEKETLIKKSISLKKINDDEMNFIIPNNWEWCSLNDIVIFTNGKAHEQKVSKNGKYYLINSKFISTNGQVIKYSSEQLSPLFINDICIVMSDVPNGRALSRCFLVDEDDKYTLNQRIGSLKPIKINPKFLLYLLDRNKYLLEFDDGKKQTNLRKEQITSTPIPLPPLKEQVEIVNKIEKLFTICDEIENQINCSKQNTQLLIQAVLKEAFEN